MSRARAFRGPAVLSFGFRPFFLLAGLWGLAAMALWLAQLVGALTLPTVFAPRDWHVHELLFGLLPCVAAGFLLTAVPNWTGRLPVVGWSLGGLAALWIVGRLAVATSGLIGAGLAATLDLAFLLTFAALIAREIIAGRNWRNLLVLVPVLVLATANALFHAEDGGGADGVGTRLGVAALVFLISLIGGRVVPSFTRNWLARRPGGPLPAPIGRFDGANLVATIAALVLWVALPDSRASGALAALAGTLGLVRLARWCGWRTLAEPLVLILHLGFIWMPIGFLALAGSILAPEAVPRLAALHLWLAGGLGPMVLAMMTRVSLGHSGRALTAGAGTSALYAAALLAVMARAAAAFWPGPGLLYLSATLWLLAYGGFVLLYAPLLVRPRRQAAG